MGFFTVYEKTDIRNFIVELNVLLSLIETNQSSKELLFEVLSVLLNLKNNKIIDFNINGYLISIKRFNVEIGEIEIIHDIDEFNIFNV